MPARIYSLPPVQVSLAALHEQVRVWKLLCSLTAIIALIFMIYSWTLLQPRHAHITQKVMPVYECRLVEKPHP